jgi:chromosome segregation ATPase
MCAKRGRPAKIQNTTPQELEQDTLSESEVTLNSDFDEKTQGEVMEEQIKRDIILQSDKEKQKKDVMIRTVKELEESIVDLRKQIDSLAAEYNAKVKMNDSIGRSIESARANVVNFERDFHTKNEKKLQEVAKRLKDIDSADKEFQELIRSNREKANKLASDQSRFDQEKMGIYERLHAAETAAVQANAQLKTKVNELDEKYAELLKEKEEFDEYKRGLEPEMARITSIKNENEQLLRFVERQREEISRINAQTEQNRLILDEKRQADVIKSQNEAESLKNEGARLRRWEQNLKDLALELKAKEVEYNKVLRRDQLQKQIEESDKKGEIKN